MSPQPRAGNAARTRRGVRRLAALVVTFVIVAALAACGSSSSSSSTESASNAAAGSSGSGASGGVAIAQAKLKQYEATPTKIVQTQSLKSPPPTGKTLVMLGTTDPGNVIIQK